MVWLSKVPAGAVVDGGVRRCCVGRGRQFQAKSSERRNHPPTSASRLATLHHLETNFESFFSYSPSFSFLPFSLPSPLETRHRRTRVNPSPSLDIRHSTVMRPSRGSRLPLLLLLPAVVSAVTFDCSHVRVDGQSFDLSELGGPHSVWRIEDTPPSLLNTTFTIDVCSPLKKTKGVAKDDECATGTRGTCAVLGSRKPLESNRITSLRH